MNILLTIFIFILVLFLYIYINNQFKKSEDLEIYEMDYYNNKNLQDVCEVRQPVIFNLIDYVPDVIDDFSYDVIESQISFDIKVKDTNDYYNISESTVDPVVISIESGLKLIEHDNNKHFLSENNDEFLEESGLGKRLSVLDDFLKPTFTVNSQRDIIIGSSELSTPFKYHTNFRKFFIVTSGKIKVKMTPWKSTKYMHAIKDYDNYEFYSPLNPNEIQSQYSRDFQKIKFLEFDVFQGYTLFIPPYWWYSIQFTSNTSIYAITYNSLMNVVSYSPQWVLYFIQQQNIFKKEAKTTTPEQKEDEQIVDKITEVIDQATEQEPSIGV
jgi:hypothetical protein